MSAPVVNLGPPPAVVAAAAAAAVVAVAVGKEVEACLASSGMTRRTITARPIAGFATNSSVAAVVIGETAATLFTALPRRQMWRRWRSDDYTWKSLVVVTVSFAHRPRPPRQDPIEVDLPQSLQAVGRASAGDRP